VFYHENLVDERSLLFGKQKSKLRKLLNEYAAAVAAHSSAAQLGSEAGLGLEESRVSQGAGREAPAFYGGSSSAQQQQQQQQQGSAQQQQQQQAQAQVGGAPSTSIIIRPDQRLSYEHLSWWFAQEGAREMPGMDQAIVERVWGHTTRTNLDGRMSVSDLKGWYISFGKRALARTPPLTAADLERELVPTAFMYDSRVSVGERVERAQAERERLEALRMEKLKEIGRAEVNREAKLGIRPATAGGSSSSSSSSSSSASSSAASRGASFVDPHGGPPMLLPSDSFDFQLRLSEEEFRAMRLRQRELLATSKFKERLEAAQAAKGGREEGGAEAPLFGRMEGPFVDSSKRNAGGFRS
jgi:hypothetical protein